MCSVQEDIEDIAQTCNDTLSSTSLVKEDRNLNICKKCGENSILLLQKKDPFCKNCFFEYSSHKFRATIGKNKTIKHGQKVLLACSGGRKSTALLHMTIQALESASVKQISFIPGILFIDESTVLPSSHDSKIKTQELLQELEKYNFPVLYTSIEMIFKLQENQTCYWALKDLSLPEDLPVCTDSENRLKECIAEMSLSSKLDFLKHLRSRFMTEIASQEGYDYLFVGESATSLAINLLTDISFGRGSQISSDTNFIDSRYKVPICRPIREFLDKELALYIYLHNCSFTVLPDLLTKTDPKSSIQRLSETFISGLQEDFPATIFTIFRTGGKLSKHDSESQANRCCICKSILDNLMPEPCSALEALKLSQELTQALNQKSANSWNELNDLFKYLCHGCSIHFTNNVNAQNFLPFITDMKCVIMKRYAMKKQIEEFMLQDDT